MDEIAITVDPDQTAHCLKQFNLVLHCLSRPFCPETWDHYGITIKVLKIRTHEKFAVVTLKFEEQCAQKMQTDLQTV